jgi:hypothetical protein
MHLPLPLVLLGVFALTIPATLAQQVVPAFNGACPSGTAYAGSGLCRSLYGAGYVPSLTGGCPVGTYHAGAGYCRTDGNTEYAPRRRGICPMGTRPAGAGYCRGR